MDDEIKPLLYCCQPGIPKCQCCFWGRCTKKLTPTQRKLYRASYDIEIWGLGLYLVGLCRVWFFGPSTVSCLDFLLESLQEKWPRRKMTARKQSLQESNDSKEPSLQRDVLEGSFARKLCFHNFNLQCLKQVWHNSAISKTVTCRNWRKSRRQLADVEGGLATKMPRTTRALPANSGANPCVFKLPSGKLT